jgi:hypothetical protein
LIEEGRDGEQEVCAEGRSYRIFVELSAEVGSEKVTATLRKGVLELTMLKSRKRSGRACIQMPHHANSRGSRKVLTLPTNHNFKQQREKS